MLLLPYCYSAQFQTNLLSEASFRINLIYNITQSSHTRNSILKPLYTDKFIVAVIDDYIHVYMYIYIRTYIISISL